MLRASDPTGPSHELAKEVASEMQGSLLLLHLPAFVLSSVVLPIPSVVQLLKHTIHGGAS